MKKNLVIDEDVVKNNSLYKKVNDIKKEKETEKQNDIIIRRRSIIVSFFLILIIIGFINFLSSISRFDNARILDKIFKQATILTVSFIVFFTMIHNKMGSIIFKIISKPSFRPLVLLSSLVIFSIIAIGPDSIFPTINGGKGWVHIGPISIQIPEIFKVPFIIVLASILARGKDNKKEISYWGNFCAVIFYTGIFFAMISFPLHDMGTAIHYVMIAAFMIFLSDIPNKILFPAFFILLFSIPGLLSIALHSTTGYKHARLNAYIDGILHGIYTREDSYQIYQSLIAFGTGGMLGKGFGNGVQKYNYIPEVETDFAIANFAEETGFVGMFIILFSFFSLFFLMMGVANNAKNYFSKYLVGGIAGYLITQVIINVGVAIGLIPVFGIPLPFISSGGSSLLAISMSMGLVIYINNRQISK